MKQTRKRIGSMLLALCMVLTMLPGVAFAEDGVIEITGFAELFDRNAGEVGSAHSIDVIRNTYLPNVIGAYYTGTGGDTVTTSWPITGWTDTDAYNPNTAGSYTFTAVLGATPAGFANSGGHTVTVEVVVKPIAFTTITDAIVKVSGSYSYNGLAQTPDVSVFNGTRFLALGTDYDVSCSSNVDAGTATVTVTGKAPNAGGTSTKTFTIQKVPLSVLANGDVITYGDAPLNQGVSYTGFVTGETEDALSGTLGYDINYTQYSDVGTYEIMPKGLSSNNYAITFKSGKLVINKKAVGLVWANVTDRKFKDGKTVTATATGLVNNDVISVAVTGGTPTDAGVHTASATTLMGEKAGNYKLPTSYTQSFAIEKAEAPTVQPVANKSLLCSVENSEVLVEIPGLPADKGRSIVTSGNVTGDTGIINGKVQCIADGIIFSTNIGTAGQTATIPVTISMQNYKDVTVDVVVRLVDKVFTEITGFAPIPDENVGKAGSAICTNAAEVVNLLQSSHPFALALHSGNQTTPFLITGWEDTDGYNPAVAGSYTFTATFGSAPDGYANSAGHTVTVEVVVSPANSSSTGGGGGSATPSTGIPVSDLSDGKKSDVTVKSNAGTVTLPSEMLGNLDAPKDAKAEVKMTAVRPSNLTPETQALVGNRPIVAINLLINGKVTDWNNPNAPVTVSIPYTPTAEELSDPKGITAYYIDGKGNLTEMVGAKYDPKTKAVVFQTTHFSYYAVGYKAATAAIVQFSDVLSDAWYYDAVSFCAEKGITNGTTATTFSPNATLTRGQFITMLLKAYGIESVAKPTDNFADAGNTYYTGYLAAAKAKGISTGVGDNKFAPEKAITRQEMFTLLYNALKVLDKLPTTDNGRAIAGFTDSGDVASWATEAMTVLVKSGTVSGTGGKLDPTGGSTRAQMTQVLYNLLGK